MAKPRIADFLLRSLIGQARYHVQVLATSFKPRFQKSSTGRSMILKNRPSRDATMMFIAHGIAARSTCVRRSVGCVLTDKYGRILSVGHNGVARGQTHCTDDPCEGANQLSGHHLDKCLAMHAEMNALLFCDDIMKVHTCYSTVSPCIQCIKALMQSSCKAIIYETSYDLHPLNLWIATEGRTYKHMEVVPDEIRTTRSSKVGEDATIDEHGSVYENYGEDFRRK